MAMPLKCRPTEAEKEPILVFMSSVQMLALKLRNGDICQIEHKESSLLAVAWLTTKADLKEGVIGVSKWLQDRAGIKLGNEVMVSKATATAQDAKTITVESLDEVEDEKKLLWELTAAVTILDNQRYVAPSQVLEVVVGRQRKKFEVLGRPNDIYKAASIAKVSIGAAREDGDDKVTFDRIGGLNSQKAMLRRIIDKIFSDRPTRRHSLTKNATGILFYGPGGTGKSSLRRAVDCEYKWSASMHWEGAGSKLPQNTPLPSLVHVVVTSKLSAQDAKLLEQMFRSLPPTTVILGEIRDPNDLHSFLRTKSAFAHEIEVSIPDAVQRHEILKLLNDGLLDEALLADAAEKTHGYVGDDLSRLLDEIELLLPDHSRAPTNCNGPDKLHENADAGPTAEHLATALTHIRPSALQQVFLEKPNVKWSDIGGQEVFKERLRNAVEWPLRYPQELKSYNVPQKKGILMYGPPGCSKTMLVKALATETDFNFLAVKGAELISMYVGESERATREVFKKARAASPCIIFFDEIDAIARRASGSSELNVLTTLLNEMDGFEELKDVLVIAATNKPQSIDPALMRPGRFDNVVYIGPPGRHNEGSNLHRAVQEDAQVQQ